MLGRLCTLLTLVFAASLSAPAQEAHPGLLVDELPSDQAEQVWRWTQDLVDEGMIAGCAAQVIRDGKLVYRSVHGEMVQGSGELIRADTMYRIYSMTKPVTSVAAMQLVEQGKLQLDEPISTHLPEWEGVKILVKDDEGAWSTEAASIPITLRHLLRHTSGLTYAHMEPGEIGKRYRAEQRENGATKTLEEMSKRLATLPLKHEPGTVWTYGHSTDVLGRLVEVVAEQPFDFYVDEHILQPLGMVDSSFVITDEKLPRLAAVHSANRKGQITGVAPGRLLEYRKENMVPKGGAGLISTLEDYGRFQTMLMNGGKLGEVQILKPETIALMIDPHDGKAQIPFARFGLGFMLEWEGRNYKVMRYASWSGAARTYFRNDHHTKTGTMLLTQTVPFDFNPGKDFHDMLDDVLVTHGDGENQE
jgi:CubicO group peptidase (beta-lactamase class C family)